MRAIAAELNQRGIPTALGTGKWSKTQVERVMSRHEELKKFRLGPGAANARIASERAAAIAPIIAEIRAAGATSLRAIVAELIKRGIPTARGTGSGQPVKSRALCRVARVGRPGGESHHIAFSELRSCRTVAHGPTRH